MKVHTPFHWILASLFALTTGCADGLNAVSVSPLYGWTDGCVTVTIQGSGFGADVNAEIGGNRLEDIELVEDGYKFTGTVPEADVDGFADIRVYDNGQEDTITGSGAYYYVQCPGLGHLSTVSTEEAARGETIALTGCQLDTATVKVVLESSESPSGKDDRPPQPLDLTATCGTAAAEFVLPAAIQPGDYFLTLVDTTGTPLSGDCGDRLDTGSDCDTFPLRVAP